MQAAEPSQPHTPAEEPAIETGGGHDRKHTLLNDASIENTTHKQRNCGLSQGWKCPAATLHGCCARTNAVCMVPEMIQDQGQDSLRLRITVTMTTELDDGTHVASAGKLRWALKAITSAFKGICNIESMAS